MPQQPAGFVPDGFVADTPQDRGAEIVRRSANAAWNAGAEFLSTVNPISTAVEAIKAGGNPAGMGIRMAQASLPELMKGIDAYKAGDTKTAARQFTKVIPLLGGVADRAWELVETKQWDRLVGLAGGVLAPFAAGKMLPKSVDVPGVMRSNNPLHAASADMMLAEGVPLDLGTVTGRGPVKFARTATDAASVAGMLDRTTPTVEGLTRTGRKIAGEVRPGGTQTAETAANATMGAARKVVERYKGTADTSYDALRQIEAQNAVDVPMTKDGQPIMRQVGEQNGKPITEQVVKTIEAPVDVSGLKAELAPIYERIKADPWYTTTKKMSDPGFKAIKTIMEGPDTVGLAELRGMRSVLGREQVGTEALGQRTSGQGLAAHAGSKVRKLVDAEAAKLGAQAQKALTDGDFAYGNMKRTAKMLEQVQSSKGAQEPVQLFDKLLRPGDANIATLRRIQKVAPGEMTALGRAWFEDGLVRATAEGEYAHAQRMNAEWQKLGPKTKEILFPDPAVRTRIDQFLHMADQWSRNPNPSGTGSMNAVFQMMNRTMKALGPTTAGGAAFAGGGVPALLWSQAGLSGVNMAIYNPTVVRALAQGFTMPVRGPVATAAALGVVGKQPTPGPAIQPVASHAQPTSDVPDEIRGALQGQKAGYYTKDGVTWQVMADGSVRKVQ